MRVSIVSHPGVKYPEEDEYYSPSIRYPEYRYDHIATKPNGVYDMVRECFAQTGLDARRFGTAKWNPLGDLIAPGSPVFVLCNFVYHRRLNETVPAFWAKCTHASVLRAVLDYVILAAGPAGKVAFGNAPLQSCNWNKVLNATGASTVLHFYAQRGVTVQARDLRLFVAERDILGRTMGTLVRDEAQEAVEIDLRTDSLLSELNCGGINAPRFRVLDYDPQRTEAHHLAGSHRYVINRAILDADVVVSLPKLKTHEKVGITCGLKGFVGAVGHKDCLAHHRLGSPAVGGDEYPDSSNLRYWISRFHDWLQSRGPHRPFQGPFQILDRSLRRVLKRIGAVPSGGWYGNNTAWRMALDVARIVRYADSSGDMRDTVQRVHLSFIDGIIGGEGDGPLSPKPVNSGTLVFSDDVAVGDRIACLLMGFDPAAIPIIREAFRPMKYPVCESVATRYTVCSNGRHMTEGDVCPVLSRRFLPPRGWHSYLEKSL